MQDILYQSADTFKVLGDRTRINILYCLFSGEKNVCTIAAEIASTPSNTSHQLKVLKDNRLVKYKKVGKEAYYSILDNHVKDIVQNMIDHVQHKCNEE